VNGRIIDKESSTKRMAALFRSILIYYSVPIPNVPDYADIEQLIEPFVRYEDRLSRSDECTRLQTQLRRDLLGDDLALARKEIEKSVLVKMPHKRK
jgi:hypothetical protein